MAGFVTAFVEEWWTGKGALGQIGFDTPSVGSEALVLGVGAAITLAATFKTLLRAMSREMSAAELSRFQAFFGLTRSDGELSNGARTMTLLIAVMVRSSRIGSDRGLPLTPPSRVR